MIKVQLNKSGFEYDIHSLVKAFFPAEEVSVGAGEKLVTEEDVLYIQTDYLDHEIEITFYSTQNLECVLKLRQKIEVDWFDRKEVKNRLKQAYYQMLCQYTQRTLPWGSLTGIRPVKIPMAFLGEGKDEDFIRAYMRKAYFTSDEKISLSIDVAKRELELLNRIDYNNGYSLYVGIPFCPSTCLYCSFTSYPIHAWESRTDSYLDALEQELDFTAEQFSRKHVHSVYIGGGTPTTLTPNQLKRLIGAIKDRLDLSCCLEFTVEAGRPDSITEEKLLALKEFGVSRISINPQTMKDETLKIMGRHHTAGQVIESFSLARELGFDHINMDLIVGLPNETISDVKATLQQIRQLDPDSLTVHSLAMKRAARLSMFREEYQNLAFLNTQETIELTFESAKQMGLEPYYLYRQKNMAGNFENVGYAKPGKEGVYNVLMMEEKQSIVACGAGSISKRVYPDGRIERSENVKEVALYMEKIDEMIERKRRLFAEL